MSDNTFVIRRTKLASDPPWSLERSFRGNPNTHAWYLSDDDLLELFATLHAHLLLADGSGREPDDLCAGLAAYNAGEAADCGGVSPHLPHPLRHKEFSDG